VTLAASTPPKVTHKVSVRLSPIIVTIVPGGPLVGEKLEIDGVTRKGTLLESVPLGVVTLTLPVVAPDGTAVLISELETIVNAAAVPLNATPVAPEEGQRGEWVDGEVEFMLPVNLRHENFLVLLITYLGQFCRANPEWMAFASNGVFTMRSPNWRMPDASLVRRARFAEGKIPVKADFGPEVAFEILSPRDSPSQIQRKRLDYQQSGVVQVWFDREKGLVELIYPDRLPQYFHEHQVLTIDAVPGFSLDLKDLFSI
jgi:Uma2 family endonuclease